MAGRGLYELCGCRVAVRAGVPCATSRGPDGAAAGMPVCASGWRGVRGGGSVQLGGQLAWEKPVGRRVAVSRR